MNQCLNRLIAVILFMLISLVGTVEAGRWDADWHYRKWISNNNAGGELSDYQVPILLNASNFDFARAAVGGAELSYWFEKWDYANVSALVCVNVLGGREYGRMWYGNSFN